MDAEQKDLIERERTWFALSIAGAIIFLVGFGVVFGLVFYMDQVGRRHLMEIAAPLGVASAAVVTFCSVVWRGLINSRQADAQREQIERLTQQISATDENNLAQLLQKGAEMIADGDRPAHAAGGLATLHAVFTANNPKFAIEAMNLTADFISERHNDERWQNLVGSARQNLAAGDELGRASSRALKLDAEKADKLWWVVKGVSRVRYSGGHWFIAPLDREMFGSTSALFSEVTFHHVDTPITIDHRFSKCTFQNCTIGHYTRSGRRSVFNDSDFSGAVIDDAQRFPDLRHVACFFRPGNPPKADADFDWRTRLQEREPNDTVPF